MTATTKKTAVTKVAPKTVALARPQSFDISRSDETLDLAKDLAKFIKENKLTTNVQGKDYVNVEGWQYAGSRLGIVPIVEHVLDLSTEQELKYRTQVRLLNLRTEQTVGAGFAVCSNKEGGKKSWAEYAIMSMAQTRAIGKAYRNCLAWIIRAAGYEPTPAEEMDSITSATVAEQATPTPGKQPAGAAAPVSAPLAASTTADQNLSSDEADHLLTDELAKLAAIRDLRTLGEWWAALPKWLATQLLAEKDAAKIRIEEAIKTAARTRVADDTPAPRPGFTLPASEPAAAEQVPRLSEEQKNEIVRLLNHPAMPRSRKTATLLTINHLTASPAPGRTDAPAVIAALLAAIDEKENGPAGNDWGAKLRRLVLDKTNGLPDEDRSRFSLIAHSPAATSDDFQDALHEAHGIIHLDATAAPAAAA